MACYRPLLSRGHQGAYQSVATFLMSVLCDSAKAGNIEETKGQAHEKGTEERLQEKRAVLTREEEARLEAVWGVPLKSMLPAAKSK